MLENYYRTLGIPADADEAGLKKAFRKLALKLHPDVNRAPDANQQFQQLCEAYEVLLRHIRHQTTVQADRREEDEDLGYSYEDVLREAREAAYKRAKMKYEKMKAEKELFEQSEWRDIFLLFNYIGRILAIPLVILLIALPVYVAVTDKIGMFFALMVFWIIGGFILIQIYSSRKTWFRQGKFNHKIKDLFKIFDFSPVTDHPGTDCYYCKNKKADSTPHKLSFHKIRDIILDNRGVQQHYAHYKRKFKEVIIPRSVKAAKVHFFQSVIKILSLVLSLMFVPYPDFIWKVCFGLSTGLVLSTLLTILTRTRSKTSYLLNSFLVVKVIIWMAIIISQSTMYPGFIFTSSENTPVYLVVMGFFGDMAMDLIFRIFPFYKHIYKPIFSQGPVIDGLYRDGYQNYLDIPVWSTVYPLFTWFF